jgi:hypothetical protein
LLPRVGRQVAQTQTTNNNQQNNQQNNNVGLAALLRRLLAHERWADEYPHVPRFLACFGAMLLELCWENVMVWCVWLVSLGVKRFFGRVGVGAWRPTR